MFSNKVAENVQDVTSVNLALRTVEHELCRLLHNELKVTLMSDGQLFPLARLM